MARYDKDRRQKELAIRYCLALGVVPCLEVAVYSAAELTDSPEILTDIDVLGLEFVPSGGLRRIAFDCKTANKMSAVNRAFWAAGLLSYAGCDQAFVILKNRPVFNHRLSALTLSVDLHDEASFEELGNTIDVSFDQDNFYQSTIDRWNLLYDTYAKHLWSESLYGGGHFLAPLSQQPWRAFRRMVAELKASSGEFDPLKADHVAIFLDVLANIFILWSTMGRDLRRVYDPKMGRADFEKSFRYYIWGGKESYQIRHEIRQKTDPKGASQEFPAWDRLVALAGILLSAPNELFGCIGICREMSIRLLSGSVVEPERRLRESVNVNKHGRQFILAMTTYLTEATGVPRDFVPRLQSELSAF